MKIKLYGLLTSLLLTACSNTYVHLVNEGYSEKEIKDLTGKLNQLPIKIVNSRITIPKEFSPSTISTHPSFTDISLLAEINSVLVSSNFASLAHLTFAQGKHFYSENHLGLYLRNESNITPIMPAYLRTQSCAFADGTIMFSNDEEFVLEFEKGPYEEDFILIKGLYNFDGKRLQLSTHTGISQSYAFSQEMKQTQFGERPADVFTPQKQLKTLKALNCQFLIIYMD
ncbi:hypothetical protein [Cognaticolwellia mytili]|uniref:hypothetical protein n=1 Tax=Cognaticolwellia mytili TaxID=1888913 RepID=UPI000A1742BC|nr:hypothetical protein [Cognaticolwellia mytili]